MDKSEILNRLKDIHSPDPVGYWPLAWGWIVLIVLLGVLLGFALWKLSIAYRHGRAKKQALLLLQEYREHYQQGVNDQMICAKIMELLKRVALAYYPRNKVAGLQGEDWIAFLNSHGRQVDFSSIRELIVVQPYHPRAVGTLTPLFNRAELWIKQRSKPCLS